MEGKVIRTLGAFGGNSMDIEISSFQSGVYFVNITHETGTEVVKFVKD
jgi:hypothetical protein